MSLYNDLGVSKDATADEIKQAHKNLAKKHHPDAGGDEETFKRIQHAYDILSDPEKRKYYDTTGHELKGELGFEHKFNDLMQRVILPIFMDAKDYSTRDIIGELKDILKRADAEIARNIRKYQLDGAPLTNLRETRKRIKAKEGDQHLMLQIIDSTIKAKETERADRLAFWKAEQEFNNKAMEEVSLYEYEHTKGQGVTIRVGPGHTGGVGFFNM